MATSLPWENEHPHPPLFVLKMYSKLLIFRTSPGNAPETSLSLTLTGSWIIAAPERLRLRSPGARGELSPVTLDSPVIAFIHIGTTRLSGALGTARPTCGRRRSDVPTFGMVCEGPWHFLFSFIQFSIGICTVYSPILGF